MPQHKATSNNLGGGQFILAAGFAAILVLMALLTVLGPMKMAEINARLQLIVQQHNVKSALVKQMRMSARERVFTLQQMMLMDDIFEQDDAALSIEELGVNFSDARKRLLAMPLTPHEQAMLDIQAKWAQQAVPLQREAVNLIVSAQLNKAKKLLSEHVLPTQQKVLATLSQLEAKQEGAIEQAFKEAVNTHHQARTLIFTLGSIATVLGILIAIFALLKSRQAAQQLFHEKERAQITLHAIGDGVISSTAEGIIEYMNPIAVQLTHWSATEALGHPLQKVFRVVDERLDSAHFLTLEEMLQTDRDNELQHCVLLNEHDERIAIELTASIIHGSNGNRTGIVVTFRDATKMRALSDHLSYQARHDPLTNLVNRREFESQLERALRHAHTENLKHALCFLDLDRFKIVNDTCGHAAGDELLKQLVARLKTLIRNNDLLARLGGDEFGLLLEQCPPQKAQQIAEEMRESVNSFVFVWEGKSFNIGVSIGMVMVDANSGDISEVVAMADAACYAAKDAGRNRVHIYSEQNQHIPTGQKTPWITRLQQALQDDSFSLYCQSIVEVNPIKEKLQLCELQLRFKDERGQQIPPMAFIPAAERHNLMPAIDRWVLRHTCQLIRLVNKPGAIYCINLSPQTINDEEFITAADNILQGHGIPTQQICFEIAETHALTDVQKMGRFVRELRERGYRIALDDVGTSIGSYDYLRNLPVHFIKIDGQLINSLRRDSISGVQIKAITQIAHLLGICVIAEMVEDHSTLIQLGNFGINYAQGFGIAKPRPVAELKEVLKTASRSVSFVKG